MFNSHPWHSHQIHLFPSNPYSAPPLPMAHKVWILDCKSCGMFLTNRGMKAVLLLRPTVSLFSSDTLPVNSSPYSSDPDAPAAYKSSLSRTCECLTQSLCCHGCGSTIGYMIVIPCSRCTSSISATNRATNGHRFVFQSSEVLGTERHYIPNEKGIIPFDTTGINAVPLLQPGNTYPTPQLNLYPSRHTDNRDSTADSYGRASSRSRSRIDSLSMPSLEFTDLVLNYSEQQPSEHDSWAYAGHRVVHSHPVQPRASHSPTPVNHPSNVMTSSTDDQSPPLLVNVNSNSSYAAEQKYAPTSPPLNAGDLIFWHHLSSSGEILGVVDDERARRPARESACGMNFDR